MQVPPLNTTRLQPVRHRTKSAILTILANGEVVIELLKKKNNVVSLSSRFTTVSLAMEEFRVAEYFLLQRARVPVLYTNYVTLT